MEKSKLLIIDDDEALCESLIDILELKGYLVDTSHNAKDGIKKVECGFYNIVLLDMKLPDSDGITLLEKIKEISPDTEVIIFTAYAEINSVIKAMDRNAFSFLPKPYEIPYMLTIIKRALEKQKIILDNRKLLQETIDAENSLRKSELLFRTLASVSPVGIWRSDRDGNCVFVNKRCSEIIGLSVEEAKGEGWAQNLHPDDRERVYKEWYQAVKDKMIFISEYRFVKPDGSSIYVFGQATPEKTEAGEVEGFVGTITDITERKKAEETLHESEERFRSTFQQAAVGIAHVAPKGHFLRVNKRFCDIAGYTEEEILKLTFQDITHTDDLSADLNLMQQVLDSKIKTYALEKRYIKNDGSIVWINLTVSLLRKISGEANYFISVIEDISKRKQAEDSLQKSEQKFRAIFNQAFQFTGLLKPDGTLIEANKGALDFAGIELSDVINKPFWETPWWSHSPAIQSFLQKSIHEAAKGNFIRFETTHLKHDGSLAYIDFSLKPYFDHNDNVIFLISEGRDITELKQIEEQVHMLSQAIEQSPVIVVITDIEGNIEYVNQKFSESTGYTYSEIIGKNPRVLKSGEKPPEEYKELWKTITSGNEWSGEFHNKKKSGELYWEYASISPIRNDDGKITHFLAVKEDITERKKIENALRESEEQFRSTFEHAGVGIVHVAPNGQFLRMNKLFCDILGHPEDEMFKLTFQDITHSDELGIGPNLTNQLLDGKVKSYTVEKRYLKKDGTIIWVNLTTSLVYKPDGEPKYLISVIEDITERKHIEQALLESEEKFRTISATANDAIIMADNDGNISYWNKASEKMFGYSSEEATGKAIYEICIPDRFHEAHLRGFKKFKDTGQGMVVGITTDLTAINSEGTEFPIEFSLSAVKIKGKWNAVAIIRNITERLRIEGSLRVSYKMASLGRLTAGVFHEILNPVNIISSHIQLLLMEAEKGSKAEEDLKSVQEEIARIVKITDSLLRFSRKGAPGTEKIEINDLLEKMISLIEPDMKLDNIRFVKKFDDRLLQISGNRDELRQVFLNLTTNARDAMPDGGTLTFSTENITGGKVPFVMIKITDTGCGIKKDKIEFVFEPFFTTKAEGKGTGLGLSTSYGIIENHGGVLSVESDVGKGTTVTINLPIKD